MLRTGLIGDVRARVAAARRDGRRVALVPTMGALHDGHLRLVARARAEADVVVMSIFINPLQFAPTDDFARYPRDAEGDAAKAAAAGVDVLFMPDAAELVPRPLRVAVEPAALHGGWEGPLRPGHFAGVLTIVLKLLNVVQPDVAVFGQKDFQQAALVRAMVRDLDVPVRVVVEPTVREADGLAMSSRNRYLDAAERRAAAAVPRALARAAAAFAAGETSAAALEAAARAELDAEPGVAVAYLGLADGESLEPAAVAAEGAVLLLSVRVGATRLLDNLVLGAP